MATIPLLKTISLIALNNSSDDIPPGSGVPVPGANAGSITSTSTDIYNLSGPSRASDIAISRTLSKPFFSISAIRCHLIP